MTSYGSLPTTAHDEERIAPIDEKGWRESLGEKLENEKFHLAVLGLILIDAACVIIQIIYTFFHECQAPNINTIAEHEETNYFLIAFECAEVISVFICLMFLLECGLHLVAFGPKYYLPGYPHWKLHVFDLLVISTTFVLEVVLRGKEREVAGLLIIFRLWRVVKITEAAIMSVSYKHQEELEQLKEDYAELERKYKAEQKKNQLLLSQQ